MKAMRKSRFFYGWVIVAALFLVTMLPMVFISNFYSYYQVPICTEFGSTYVQFNISNIASTIAGMAFSLFAAKLVTKGDIRLWMFVGGAVAALAMLAQSYITSLWQLYITFFVANFALSSMTYVPINYIIARWFVDKKALVTSIVFTGSGLGGVLFSGLASGIIADAGWRVGFRVTAAIVFVTSLIVLLVVRKAPEDMGLSPYTKRGGSTDGTASASTTAGWSGLTRGEAVRTSSFWFYVLCLVCCGIVAAGVATQIPTYLTENGIDYAPVFAVYSGVGIVAKLVVGPVIDKLGLSRGCLITSLLGMAALIFLVMVPGLGSWASYVSMIILPFGSAITALAPSLLTGMCFGQKDFGGIYGLGNTAFMAGCMIGPMLSSGLRDAFGSYQLAWYACMAAYALITIFTVLASSSAKKLRSLGKAV